MHEQFDDLCVLYSSGELSTGDLERFNAHKKGCPLCAELLAALEASARVAELAAVSLPESRVERMCEEALGRGTGPKPVVTAWAWARAWGAGAALAVLSVGLYVASARRGQDLSWSGLDKDVARLDTQIARLDGELSVEDSDEIGSDLGELEARSKSLERLVAGK